MADDKVEDIDKRKSAEGVIIEQERKDIDKRKSAEGVIIEQERDEGGEEARIIKGKKMVRQPTQEEYDEHMRTHIPFRKWCPHCVKGKRKNDPHRAPKEKELGRLQELLQAGLIFQGNHAEHSEAESVSSSSSSSRTGLGPVPPNFPMA